ncbi:hypothetical protein K503DRAFT_690778, partial [Rhizopogon vinicolor AM-OR11-026]
PANEITDDLLKSCASLFNANYGIWGLKVGTASKFTKLVNNHYNWILAIAESFTQENRSMCIFSREVITGNLIDTSATLGNQLIGHAFASLVVDKSVCKRYIATQLLQTLKFHSLFESVKVVDLVSSHPAACNALAKLCL